MEELEVHHLVTKLVQKNATLRHFFEIRKRPKGFTMLTIAFHFKDIAEPFVFGYELKRMGKLERQSAKKGATTTFFCDVPAIPDLEKINLAAKTGILKVTVGEINIPISGKFEDVLAEAEKFYSKPEFKK